MIAIDVDITPPKAVGWLESLFGQDIGSQLGGFLTKVAVEIGDEMKKSFALPKHGRLYIRSHKTRKSSGRSFRRVELIHRASAPGEPPANDSGTLARSISVQSVGNFSVLLLIGTEYAEFLDEGTTQMQARPFINPAILAVTERINAQNP